VDHDELDRLAREIALDLIGRLLDEQTVATTGHLHGRLRQLHDEPQLLEVVLRLLSWTCGQLAVSLAVKTRHEITMNDDDFVELVAEQTRSRDENPEALRAEADICLHSILDHFEFAVTPADLN
jgi:hypothetical protein